MHILQKSSNANGLVRNWCIEYCKNGNEGRIFQFYFNHEFVFISARRITISSSNYDRHPAIIFRFLQAMLSSIFKIVVACKTSLKFEIFAANCILNQRQLSIALKQSWNISVMHQARALWDDYVHLTRSNCINIKLSCILYLDGNHFKLSLLCNLLISRNVAA